MDYFRRSIYRTTVQYIHVSASLITAKYYTLAGIFPINWAFVIICPFIIFRLHRVIYSELSLHLYLYFVQVEFFVKQSLIQCIFIFKHSIFLYTAAFYALHIQYIFILCTFLCNTSLDTLHLFISCVFLYTVLFYSVHIFIHDHFTLCLEMCRLFRHSFSVTAYWSLWKVNAL